MSYQIGQFRKDSLNGNYIQDLSYTITTVETPWGGNTDSSSLEIVFTDRALQLARSLQSGQNYFLKVGIERQSLRQRINIILKNNNSTTNRSQTITSFTIPPLDNTNNKTAILETIISPNSAYDQIILQLTREIPQDFQTTNRIVNVTDDDTVFGVLTNIVNIVGVENGFTKIGVQGPSGLLMCINGEEIRIGPSGIYEIKNGYTVSFIGFAILSDDTNYFILDYQY